jgi:hypothetical protein
MSSSTMSGILYSAPMLAFVLRQNMFCLHVGHTGKYTGIRHTHTHTHTHTEHAQVLDDIEEAPRHLVAPLPVHQIAHASGDAALQVVKRAELVERVSYVHRSSVSLGGGGDADLKKGGWRTSDLRACGSGVPETYQRYDDLRPSIARCVPQRLAPVRRPASTEGPEGGEVAYDVEIGLFQSDVVAQHLVAFIHHQPAHTTRHARMRDGHERRGDGAGRREVPTCAIRNGRGWGSSARTGCVVSSAPAHGSSPRDVFPQSLTAPHTR